MNDLSNFNEILRKDVPYDNIKSHRKPGFHPFFRRYIFWEITGGGQFDSSPPPPSSHFSVKNVFLIKKRQRDKETDREIKKQSKKNNIL